MKNKMSLPAAGSVLLIFVLSGFLSYPAKAQIVLEKTYPYSGTITQLEKLGTKFYLMDVPAEECRIYNMDYSLYKTIKLNVPNDRYLYDIQFVTQNLFDSDDGVELLYVYSQYVQTATSYYYIYTTRIADENGSVLLDVPGGSWSDIKNAGTSGSKLMIWVTDYSVYPYPVETRIYSLPGQVMSAETEAAPDAAAGRLYPNPTTGLVQAQPSGFGLTDKAEWVILDSAGKLIARMPAGETGKPIDLKSMGLVAGIYYIRMESKNYQTKFQQIVLSN